MLWRGANPQSGDSNPELRMSLTSNRKEFECELINTIEFKVNASLFSRE